MRNAHTTTWAGLRRKPARLLAALVFFVLLALLVACGGEPEIIVVTATFPAQRATVAPIPSIYPTHTRESAFEVITEAEFSATPTVPRATATAVDFTQPALSFRYAIPAIGLDRTATGSLASVLTLRDETTGAEEIFPNQGGYLVQIETVLDQLALAPLPAGCDRCVYLSYSLPFAGQAAEGWLQDPIIIASIERLFTDALGPHFPPDTALGLHRRVAGYSIGHTAAVLADGTVWAWNAPDASINPPRQLTATERDQLLDFAVNRLWGASYEAACPYYPHETLFINGDLQIDVTCPELSLPITLLPIYEGIDRFTADSLADERNVPYPAQPLPLDARIYYERIDQASITIFNDGRFVVTSAAGDQTEGQIRAEEVDGFVSQIIATEVVPLGVTLATQDEILNEQDGVELDTGEREYEELLLVRGDLGVHELGWSNGIGQGLVPAVTVLDVLLIDEIGLPEPTPVSEP